MLEFTPTKTDFLKSYPHSRVMKSQKKKDKFRKFRSK